MSSPLLQIEEQIIHQLTAIGLMLHYRGFSRFYANIIDLRNDLMDVLDAPPPEQISAPSPRAFPEKVGTDIKDGKGSEFLKTSRFKAIRLIALKGINLIAIGSHNPANDHGHQ